jgi:hypothetical protein
MEQLQFVNPELVNAPSWYAGALACAPALLSDASALSCGARFAAALLCTCIACMCRERAKASYSIHLWFTHAGAHAHDRSPITSMLDLQEGSNICVIAETCAALRHPAQAVIW